MPSRHFCPPDLGPAARARAQALTFHLEPGRFFRLACALISHHLKFIYVHIPKTGGNSIQTVLGPHSSDRLVYRPSVGQVLEEDGTQGLDVINEELGFVTGSHKHAAISDYAAALGRSLGDYRVLCSVRNPWDRVISYTAFGTPGGLAVGRTLRPDELRLPRRQVDYLTLDGNVSADHVIRFERLNEDLGRVCAHLGIPCCSPPHKNRSRRDDYRLYYTDETADYVAMRYRDDITRFGYRFDLA